MVDIHVASSCTKNPLTEMHCTRIIIIGLLLLFTKPAACLECPQFLYNMTMSCLVTVQCISLEATFFYEGHSCIMQMIEATKSQNTGHGDSHASF